MTTVGENDKRIAIQCMLTDTLQQNTTMKQFSYYQYKNAFHERSHYILFLKRNICVDIYGIVDNHWLNYSFCLIFMKFLTITVQTFFSQCICFELLFGYIDAPLLYPW